MKNIHDAHSIIHGHSTACKLSFSFISWFILVLVPPPPPPHTHTNTGATLTVSHQFQNTTFHQESESVAKQSPKCQYCFLTSCSVRAELIATNWQSPPPPFVSCQASLWSMAEASAAYFWPSDVAALFSDALPVLNCISEKENTAFRAIHQVRTFVSSNVGHDTLNTGSGRRSSSKPIRAPLTVDLLTRLPRTWPTSFWLVESCLWIINSGWAR